MVQHTGLAVPLAAQMIGLIMDSGASHYEAETALRVTEALLQRLPISLRPDSSEDPQVCANRPA